MRSVVPALAYRNCALGDLGNSAVDERIACL
jgi:hypothetical protein